MSTLPATKLSAEISPFPEQPYLKSFGLRLRDAEEEARLFDQQWTASKREKALARGAGLISNAGVPEELQKEEPLRNALSHYDHDVTSADEEVRSNVREVELLNIELEQSEAVKKLLHDAPLSLSPPTAEETLYSEGAFSLIGSVIEIVREPLVILDDKLVIRKANRGFHRTFVTSEGEITGSSIYEFSNCSWDIPDLRKLLDKVILDNRAYEEVEINQDFAQTGHKTLRLNVRRIVGGSMILMSIRDVTPRRRTEVELHRVQDELRQGQKMEVIGRLAGGIAHDFNNILTGILGFSEALLHVLELGSDTHHYAGEIKKASERAAALTQQLLAFSRRQVLQPQILNVGRVVVDLVEMLRTLIGERIELLVKSEEEPWLIYADPGQIGQIVLNLALNGRDAMRQEGTLTIATENTVIRKSGEALRGLNVGDYVTLSVTDSGTGMDLETQEHIFEPFYTTKPQGSGTGLGLATVFGIVQQSGASINFTSRLGSGTTFWIDFPRSEGVAFLEPTRECVAMPTGSETILLVEDDEIVRELVTLVLGMQGYTVLAVGDAKHALEMCETHTGGINLLLTDLLIPGVMNGRELTIQAGRVREGIRVVLMSGYTTDALALYGIAEGAPFLQKPFTHQQLLAKIRDTLDNPILS